MTAINSKDIPGMSVWALTQKGLTLENYTALKTYAQTAARNFEFRFLGGLSSIDQDLTNIGKNPPLDLWVNSGEGQKTLLDLTIDLQRRIRGNAKHALPAHDIRQILYKDACEGLRFAANEMPEGYKSSFIVPMFSHDIGRLLEGRFYSLGIPHDDWIPHSQLSFLMMREVLQNYPQMPQPLKDHFMYAVLAHSGENAQTYIGRAVQTCDRMQLIGPEGFFRAVSYVAGLTGGSIAYPRTQEYQLHPPALHTHRSAIAVLEHYGRNGYANIGDDHYVWQKHMEMLNTAILLRMAECSADLGEYMLAPEQRAVPKSSLGPYKKEISVHDAHDLLLLNPLDTRPQLSRQDLFETLVDILESPIGAATLPAQVKGNIRNAVMELKSDELSYIQQGIFFSASLKDALDLEDDRLVDHILGQGGIELERVIAAEAATFRRRDTNSMPQPAPAGRDHK
jgi:hypothetical protein